MSNMQCVCGDMDFQHKPNGACSVRKGVADRNCGCCRFAAAPVPKGMWTPGPSQDELIRRSEIKAALALYELDRFICEHVGTL